MDNHDDLHITLTLLIGVAVGCGVLYWAGRNAAPAPFTSTTPAVPFPAAPMPPSIPQSVVAQPVEHARDPRVAKTQAQETAPNNYDSPDLPVVFAISERSLYTTEENTEGNMINVLKRVKEGIISNSSDKPLTITAIEVNIATQDTWQTQFVLSTGTQKHFGTDQGLKMTSGDQMTLRSPSYKDLVQPIP